MESNLSSRIQKIYLDEDSPYFLSGISAFKKHLLEKYHIKISYSNLQNILRKLPLFQQLSENKRTGTKNQFRSIKGFTIHLHVRMMHFLSKIVILVLGTNIEIFGDLVYMPGSKTRNRTCKYIGFYAFVDAFSKKAVCHPTDNASGKGFRDIFYRVNTFV